MMRVKAIFGSSLGGGRFQNQATDMSVRRAAVESNDMSVGGFVSIVLPSANVKPKSCLIPPLVIERQI